MKRIDLTGMRFGMLTVTGLSTQVGKVKELKWHCSCDCGGTSIAFGNNLRRGTTVACGCRSTKHTLGGLRSHPMYKVWKTMIYRCTKPSRKEYKNYGGRGISVCERWMTFAYFIEDMYEGYDPSLQLDRNDNDGNYEKSNCNWVTPLENKRKTRRTKLDKEKVAFIKASPLIAEDLAKMFNCCKDTIYDARNGNTWT